MQEPLAPKQIEFIKNSVRHWNIAHGAVRSGKTVCTLFRFMQACATCPDSKIYMVGHSADTIYQNAVRLIFETPELDLFRPFCTWQPGKRQLRYRDKVISCYGAKDEGAIGNFQGKTMSLLYCDEMTLYPESIINMLDTRLSLDYSMGFASMNPSHPGHQLKKWIDLAQEGDPNYYALHFTIDDNPFLDHDYKERIRKSTSGLFYKRNYLGIWCLADGAIFDFFDRDIHTVKRAPRAAEYYIAGLDYGVSNAFACLVVGVNTGISTQQGKQLWVEDEFYWDSKKTHKQLLNSEFAEHVQEFLEPYGVKQVYMDPSALSMKLELQRKGFNCIAADNDVFDGIQLMCSEVGTGRMLINRKCVNLIREIEGYVWDTKKSQQGEDAPVKKADHLIDAWRYVIKTHKVQTYNPYKQQHNPQEYIQNRFQVRSSF